MKKYTKPSDIRVGVVGYGGAYNMGRGHLLEMRQAGMTPVAVCEIDKKRLAAARDDFPRIQTFNSLDAMLRGSDVELVTLITPHNTHAKLALECIKAGRHVVCEKPMAITTAECDKMIAAAKKARVVLSAYHNRHWDGLILRALEQVVQEKKIGDVFRIDIWWGHRRPPEQSWRGSRSISGGLLYDWGVHLIEYALQIARSDLVEVSGFAKSGYWAPKSRWKKDTVEDEAGAVVRFKNGIKLSINVSGLESNVRPGFFQVTGTEGAYLILDWSKYQIHRRLDSKVTIEEGTHPLGTPEEYYRNLASHLVDGEPLVITPEWARRPIHVLDLAGQSARLGRTLSAKHR